LKHSKILFKYDESTEGSYEVESVWAVPDGQNYKLDNIPFYARGVALDDLVIAAAEDDEVLWYRGVVRPSGRSTIRLWFSRVEDVQTVRDELRKLGCASEISNLPRLVAVDIPSSISYAAIKGFFDRGEAAGQFEYEEACLGQPM
jgi:hypothetical protein